MSHLKDRRPPGCATPTGTILQSAADSRGEIPRNLGKVKSSFQEEEIQPGWNLRRHYSLLDSGTGKYHHHQLPPVVPPLPVSFQVLSTVSPQPSLLRSSRGKRMTVSASGLHMVAAVGFEPTPPERLEFKR
ncbi:UNVERIFIED_CONTAM: hypothetical protein FKN15_013905 [Acipenser sinensis]